jgi:hypothetical protein
LSHTVDQFSMHLLLPNPPTVAQLCFSPPFSLFMEKIMLRQRLSEQIHKECFKTVSFFSLFSFIILSSPVCLVRFLYLPPFAIY